MHLARNAFLLISQPAIRPFPLKENTGVPTPRTRGGGIAPFRGAGDSRPKVKGGLLLRACPTLSFIKESFECCKITAGDQEGGGALLRNGHYC